MCFESMAYGLNKNKKWIALGLFFYLIPVIYRIATNNPLVPILDNTLFLYHNNSQIMPVNLETLGALFIILSALGAVIGTSFLEHQFTRRFAGLEKYFARLLGSLFFTLAWILIQFLGYNFFNPVGSWGSHLWSSSSVYAKNLLIALVIAPLVPYLVEFIYKRIKK